LALESKLNVLPAQRQALVAGLKAKQAGLGQAKLDLERTVLKAPFECRLSEVSLEVGQFLIAGQVLFEAHGVAVAEIEAQVPIERLRTLLPPREDEVDLSENAMKVMRSIFDVTAVVRMRSGDFVVQWDGRFDRIREGLDIQTRTVQVVVVVDNPYEGVVPGKRPPLAPGMFCEVELRAAARADQIVIPRICARDGNVFVVDEDNRLVKRPVNIGFSQGAISIVADGLAAGERLVVSDPTPAIEGMLVEPTLDEAVAKRLVAQAAGEGDVR
jgi:RND family efflux transporter MFP subunit